MKEPMFTRPSCPRPVSHWSALAVVMGLLIVGFWLLAPPGLAGAADSRRAAGAYSPSISLRSGAACSGCSAITPLPDQPITAAFSSLGTDALLSPTGDLQATELATHTIFLPQIAKKYGGPLPPFGVQLYQADANTAQTLTDLGAGWGRITLSWSLIEPTKTTPEYYQWNASFDQRLAGLASNGRTIILTLGDNPSWAATYRGGPIDLVDISELVEFMTAAVGRYSAPPYNVKYWEIYNEPDNGNSIYGDSGFGYFGHTPDLYVDLLEAIYQPIKAVDPQAQILLGGLAYGNWEPSGPFVQNFLDQVLRPENDGARFFDIMNFHYYPSSDWESYGADIIGKATYLRQKLSNYGVDKPVICTETGTYSATAYGGSDELQSRYVPQVFVRSIAADLISAVWFTLVDDSGPYSRKHGLLDANLSPKPSYYAFQTLSRHLASAQYSRKLRLAETGSDEIEAYEFSKSQGLTRIVVAWTQDDAMHSLRLESTQLVMVDKFGAETVIYDGDDFFMDGRVRVTIGPSPVYLYPGGTIE
jgi:hypothetical protein